MYLSQALLSSGARLPVFTARLPGAFCPGQAPPDFLLCVQTRWTRCQGGLLTDVQSGHGRQGCEQAVMMRVLSINTFAEDFKLLFLMTAVPWLEIQAYSCNFMSLLIWNPIYWWRE